MKTRNFFNEVFDNQEIDPIFLNKPINSIGLPVNLQNRLADEEVTSVHDLLTKTGEEIAIYMRDPRTKKRPRIKKSEKPLEDLKEILWEEYERFSEANTQQVLSVQKDGR